MQLAAEITKFRDISDTEARQLIVSGQVVVWRKCGLPDPSLRHGRQHVDPDAVVRVGDLVEILNDRDQIFVSWEIV
jgi:hypothetical protein